MADLNGPIHVTVVGFIDSVKGRVRTRFQNIPDAPVSRFVLKMKGGSKGLLANSENLCSFTPRAKVQIRAERQDRQPQPEARDELPRKKAQEVAARSPAERPPGAVPDKARTQLLHSNPPLTNGGEDDVTDGARNGVPSIPGWRYVAKAAQGAGTSPIRRPVAFPLL